MSWFFEVLDAVQRALCIGLSVKMISTIRTVLYLTYDMFLPVLAHMLSPWPDHVIFIDYGVCPVRSILDIWQGCLSLLLIEFFDKVPPSSIT